MEFFPCYGNLLSVDTIFSLAVKTPRFYIASAWDGGDDIDNTATVWWDV